MIVARPQLVEPFLHGDDDLPARLHLRRPPGVGARSRSPTSTSSSARACSSTCARTRARSGRRSRSSRDLPIVGDVRGDGYFYGIELVKDKATKETFDDDESERLLRGFLSRALFDAGLICRADDRGDPVIQLAPPLISASPSSTTSSRSCARCSPRPGRRSDVTLPSPVSAYKIRWTAGPMVLGGRTPGPGRRGPCRCTGARPSTSGNTISRVLIDLAGGRQRVDDAGAAGQHDVPVLLALPHLCDQVVLQHGAVSATGDPAHRRPLLHPPCKRAGTASGQ